MSSGDLPIIPCSTAQGGGETRGESLSEILNGIAQDTSRERISVSDLLAAMHDRAFGAMMFIFALPNVLPTPPGTSLVLGTPLLFLSAQLMLGRKPWLPAVIGARSLARTDFAALMLRAGPWLTRAERLLKPRLSVLTRAPCEYAVGAIILLMATILFLPLMFGNMLPAFAICLFSLGILERDGLWIAAGLVTALVATVLIVSVYYAVIMSGIYLVTRYLW
jgi:hypothetical protein